MEVLKHRQKKIEIDESLFPRISKGDDNAFEELYYLTYKPMYAFILSMTLNREDAEDILQETYIKIRGACHLYHERGNPMAWMMKIAKNLYLMKLRSEKRQKTVNIDDCRIEDYRNELSLEQISVTEDRLLLEQLFQNISGEDRDIIIMHVVMGMKHREIAELLDMQIGTVLSKYHRSMKLLKRWSKVQKEKGA